MGFKIVRDGHEAWSAVHGVSGTWRTSPDPVAGLARKLIEEAAEFGENHDPAELHDLADVVDELLALTDPHGKTLAHHQAKTARLGLFGKYVEWSPVPPEHQGDVL